MIWRFAMKIQTRAFGMSLAVLLLLGPAFAQEQKGGKKEAGKPQEFGKSYATLRPEQKRLVDDLIRRYNVTAGSKVVPQPAYDAARMSVRTTFDGVTHALLTTGLTNVKGSSLGRAIDLVDAI